MRDQWIDAPLCRVYTEPFAKFWLVLGPLCDCYDVQQDIRSTSGCDSLCSCDFPFASRGTPSSLIFDSEDMISGTRFGTTHRAVGMDDDYQHCTVVVPDFRR